MSASYQYYLDASALVRLAVHEPGTTTLRDYFHKHHGACATIVSFIESLGVLKRKWQGDWSNPDYHKAVEELQIPVYGEQIELDEISLANPNIFKEVSMLAGTHGLDFADALQLYAITKGKYSPFVGGSNTRFISADKALVKASRNLSIATWNCGSDNCINWA